MLSSEHLKKHLIEMTNEYLTAGDGKGGGHSGVSLNIFCGVLGENPDRVMKLALETGYFRVAVCGIPSVPLFYRKSTSIDYTEGKYYHPLTGKLVDENPNLGWSVWLAKKFPGCGFVHGMAYRKEFERVVQRMGWPVAKRRMTDETCLLCHKRTEKDKSLPNIYDARSFVKDDKPLGDGGFKVYEKETNLGDVK